MPELLDGQTVISSGPVLDKDAADREFERAMVTPSDGGLPQRQALPADDPKPRRGRKPKAEQPRVTAAAAAAGPLGNADRRKGVKAVVQVGAAIPLVLARATGKDAYKADAVTIANSADDIAGACADAADADPRFAAALDRVCQAGPYGALITVAFGVAGQLVRNHRPGLEIPGTVHPDKLLAGPEPEQQAA